MGRLLICVRKMADPKIQYHVQYYKCGHWCVTTSEIGRWGDEFIRVRRWDDKAYSYPCHCCDPKTADGFNHICERTDK